MDFQLTDFNLYKQLGQKDRRVAGIVAGSFVVALFALLYFLGFSIPTPPLPNQLLYKDMEMEILVPLEAMPMEVGPGGGGSGTPTKANLSQDNPPQMEQVLTQQGGSIKHPSGGSNHTNTTKPNNNPPTTQNQSNNPFGTGGSGGGDGKGNGSGVGDYDGSGSGEGSGPGTGGGSPKRVRITDPVVHDIDSDESGSILVEVIVDAAGKIVGSPKANRAKTTITNETVIRTVLDRVKSQVRFNAVPGAANVKLVFTVKITPN